MQFCRLSYLLEKIKRIMFPKKNYRHNFWHVTSFEHCQRFPLAISRMLLKAKQYLEMPLLKRVLCLLCDCGRCLHVLQSVLIGCALGLRCCKLRPYVNEALCSRPGPYTHSLRRRRKSMNGSPATAYYCSATIFVNEFYQTELFWSWELI